MASPPPWPAAQFVCPKGRIKIAIYDDREESSTQGEFDTFVIGEHNEIVVRVPDDCWHGFKVIGDEPAFRINFPTNLYDYDNPDKERLSDHAEETPFDWEEPVHG